MLTVFGDVQFGPRTHLTPSAGPHDGGNDVVEATDDTENASGPCDGSTDSNAST